MSIVGKRILVTRSRQQASSLAEVLAAEGAQPILIPSIELAPPASFEALDRALQGLAAFDWVLFTSANAVRAFAARSKELGIRPEPGKIAVIGSATARAVAEIGLTVDLIPSQFVAESFATALAPCAPGARMLLVRAEQARDVLPEALTAAGAQLTIAPAYRNVIPSSSVALLQELFANEPPDAATFTSSSTAANLFSLLEAAAIALPEQVVRASIGPITSQTLRERGYPPHLEARESTVTSLVVALVEHFHSL